MQCLDTLFMKMKNVGKYSDDRKNSHQDFQFKVSQEIEDLCLPLIACKITLKEGREKKQ